MFQSVTVMQVFSVPHPLPIFVARLWTPSINSISFLKCELKLKGIGSLYVGGGLSVAAENVSSVYLSVGGVANGTRMQTGVLRLTADVGVDLKCTVVGGMPPPSVDVFLNGVNVTEQVRCTVSSTVHPTISLLQ